MGYPEDFEYNALLKSDQSGRVSSILASQSPADLPLRAVMWSGRRKETLRQMSEEGERMGWTVGPPRE